MERCWFAGVKCDLKAVGVQLKGEERWTLCPGAALAKVRGRGLDWGWIVVLLREFFFRCYFTVLWRDFSGGTGYIGQMVGTVQGL